MKKLHLIVLSLLAVSLITHCPANSPGNPPNGTQPPTVDNMMPPPTVDNMMPPPTVDNIMPPPTVDNIMPPPTVDNMMQLPTDVNTIKTINVHVNDNVADDTTVVALAGFFTVTTPTYSILEGNAANIFSIDSSTGVITLPDASRLTYDATTKTNNIHLLKVRARDGSDSTKATEAPLRIVVRGENGAFITTWKTTTPNEMITIPTTGSGYNYTVNWGDSSAETTYTGDATHTYTAANTYTVIITGTFPHIYFNDFDDNADNNATGDNKTKIQTVEQWGSIAWSSMTNAFYGAENLTVPAVDAPDLTRVTSMQSIFRNTAINQDINHLDTSSIQDMSFMFAGASVFNQDIGDWNTAMVNDMNNMFANASVFNQDISNWNTAMVNDMNSMFNGATTFNQDISSSGDSWNTAMVNDMSYMFAVASAFDKNIGNWNTAKVTNMSRMFANASVFNQNIGAWKTGMVNDMNSMFASATVFNQDISNWNTAMVEDMSFMFTEASAFNQNIRDWMVGAVTAVGKCAFFRLNSGLTDANRPTFSIPACN